MPKIKKLISSVLTLALILSLCACSTGTTTKKVNKGPFEDLYFGQSIYDVFEKLGEGTPDGNSFIFNTSFLGKDGELSVYINDAGLVTGAEFYLRLSDETSHKEISEYASQVAQYFNDSGTLYSDGSYVNSELFWHTRENHLITFSTHGDYLSVYWELPAYPQYYDYD